LIDTRPYAHALHHYVLNHRDLCNLPRKFNVAFEGGGAVDTVADTNDLGFMAVRMQNVSEKVDKSVSGNETAPRSASHSLTDSLTHSQPGVFFRVELCGITGHKQFARDAGIIIKPAEAVAVAA